MLTGETYNWKSGNVKYTPRDNFHKVEALEVTWALCFRGPWSKTWNDSKNGDITTLTHGRIIVNK